MPVRLGPMAKGFAEGANIRRQSRITCQRVEDNAFHLCAPDTLSGQPSSGHRCGCAREGANDRENVESRAFPWRCSFSGGTKKTEHNKRNDDGVPVFRLQTPI